MDAKHQLIKLKPVTTYIMGRMNIGTTFCPFGTVTKSCPVETVPACPVQIRAHRHIAVYIDSNKNLPATCAD